MSRSWVVPNEVVNCPTMGILIQKSSRASMRMLLVSRGLDVTVRLEQILRSSRSLAEADTLGSGLPPAAI